MQYTRKLDEMEARFEQLTSQTADPQVISDSETYRKTAKAQSELSEVVTKYRAAVEAWERSLAEAKARNAPAL